MPAKPFVSDTDAEKMSTQSDSTSAISEPLPVAIAEPDLEKIGSHATQGSRRSNPPSERVVTTAEDWDGPDDVENPMHWPLKKKIYHTLVPGLQAFVVTFGSSVYTPSVSEVAAHFRVSVTAALVPLAVYVLGLGFGPMISAPISENWGRRAVYLWFFPPSLLFTLGAGFSTNFAGLVICRFLAAMVGSGTLAVGAGSNSDLWAPYQRAVASSIFMLAPFLGPALGPAIGGYVAMKKDWRWTQWVILFWGAIAFAITVPQRETYKRIILSQRAKRLGIPGPPSIQQPGVSKIRLLLMVTLLRPMNMLVTESIVSFFSIYTAFNFGIIFAFFAAFPIVFRSPYPEIQVYHFNTGEGGLVFLGLGLGVFLGCLVSIVIDRVVYRKKTHQRRAQGDFTPLAPEERLQGAMIGSFLLPVSLFWFAWTARSDVHWIVPIISTVPFGIGNFLVFFSAILYLIDTYGPFAGASAVAANGLLRYGLGAAFPLFAVQMYQAMGVAWATSLLAFVTVALLPIPWILYNYGPTIRKRSAFAPVR